MLQDALDFVFPVLFAALPYLARYRSGVALLMCTTVLLGGAMVANELWHWLTPRTFYGINPLAWLGAATAITLVYLPRATKRSLRMCQFAVALIAAEFIPLLGSWIS